MFGFTARAFWRVEICGLAVSFKELLETVGKIYCQGKRTTKTQAVCLELGPLCSISGFPLPTQPPPPAWVITGRFSGRRSVVLDIFYQTAHFFWLDMCDNLYFGKTLLLRNAKLVRVCKNYRKVCFKHKRCSLSYAGFLARNGLRVFAPPRNVLRPLRGWREGTDDISDYDLVLFPPQCHFSENTGKEFIIVFNEGPRDWQNFRGTLRHWKHFSMVYPEYF